MNKEFVKYEQALVLKELGFDEPCIGWYNPQVNYKKVTTDRYWAFHLTGEWENFKPSPLYQQAFRFFREKHNLVFNFISYNIVKPGEYHWSITWNDEAKAGGIVKTYEEAESTCLDKLIEILKLKLMTKEFVKYEQALALKELGFDEPCFGYYDEGGNLYTEMVEVLKAPLYQQAFRWFRENHGLYNEMFVDDDKTFGFLSLDKLIEIVKNK